GQELCTYRGHEDLVVAVAFQQGGDRLASVSDGTLRIWDATSDQKSRTLYRASHGARPVRISMALSPEGRLVAMGLQDGTVRFCDGATSELCFTLRAHTKEVWDMAFSPCGRFVATSSLESIKVWDMATRRELFHLLERSPVPPSMAFTHDGRQFAASYWPGPIHLWDTENGQPIRDIRGGAGIRRLAFSMDGTAIFAIGGNALVKLWGTANGE